jgi:hypothetical protein
MKTTLSGTAPLLGAVLSVLWLAAPSATADVWDVGPAGNGADNTPASTLNVLVNGAVQIHDLAALSTTDTCPAAPCPDEDWYFVLTYPNTSHEVVVEGVTPNAGAPSLTRHDWMSPGPPVQTAPFLGAAATPGSTRSLRWETPSQGTPGWFPAQSIAVGRTFHAACGATCDATAQYTIRLYDTTATVPRFNNTGGQVTILILYNPVTYDAGDGTHLITGHVNFYTGGPGQAPFQVPFMLLESDSLVLNTATVVPGQAGRITITHDGRYGQLVGKATAVEPATGFSFDTPLVTMPH